MGSSQTTARKRDVALLDQVTEAAQFAASGGEEGQDLSSRVELSIGCANFKKQINCKVVIHAKNSQEALWAEVGETEVCYDTQAPSFVKSSMLKFTFEVQQKLRLEVYSVTDSTGKVTPSDLMGTAECFLAEVVAARNGQIRRNIDSTSKPGTSFGVMVITAEEMQRMQTTVRMKVRCEDLPVADVLTRSADPYLVISRTNPAHQEGELGYSVPVYRTEAIHRTLNPRWEESEITEQQLCRGDEMRLIQFEVFDWNRRQQHAFLGNCYTTFSDIQKSSVTGKFLCMQLFKSTQKPVISIKTGSSSKDKRKSNRHVGGEDVKKIRKEKAGVLFIERVIISKQYTFLDYIFGGLEISLILGIDFSRSNGDPSSSDSLHYFNTQEPNDYVMALKGVGEILQHYDSDQRYPVYGFGARLPPSYTISSNCFSMNGDYFSPEVIGIEGIVDSYRDALQTVRLHGPTELAGMVRMGSKWAETAGEQNKTEASRYFILLIITDGSINDIQATVDEVVRSARLPMSIIIVGVGNGDFSQMETLDADKNPLFSASEQIFMERDIIQFVPFNEFKERSYHDLAMATLDEIPREVVGYFRSRGVVPQKVIGQNKGGKTSENNKEKPVRQKITPQSELPEFLNIERSQLIHAVTSQGYSREDVLRVIDAGIPAVDPLYVIDILSHNYQKYHAGDAKKKVGNNVTTLSTGGKRNLPGPFQDVLHSFTGRYSSSSTSQAATSALVLASDKPTTSPSRPTEEVIVVDPILAASKGGIGTLCNVCFARHIDCRLIPCNHEVSCFACTREFGILCPLCRNTINSITKFTILFGRVQQHVSTVSALGSSTSLVLPSSTPTFNNHEDHHE